MCKECQGLLPILYSAEGNYPSNSFNHYALRWLDILTSNLPRYQHALIKLGFSLSYQFIFSDCLTDFPRTGNIFTVFCGCSKPIKICYNCLKGVSSIVINYRFFILYSGDFSHFHRLVYSNPV